MERIRGIGAWLRAWANLACLVLRLVLRLFSLPCLVLVVLVFSDLTERDHPLSHPILDLLSLVQLDTVRVRSLVIVIGVVVRVVDLLREPDAHELGRLVFVALESADHLSSVLHAGSCVFSYRHRVSFVEQKDITLEVPAFDKLAHLLLEDHLALQGPHLEQVTVVSFLSFQLFQLEQLFVDDLEENRTELLGVVRHKGVDDVVKAVVGVKGHLLNHVTCILIGSRALLAYDVVLFVQLLDDINGDFFIFELVTITTRERALEHALTRVLAFVPDLDLFACHFLEHEPALFTVFNLVVLLRFHGLGRALAVVIKHNVELGLVERIFNDFLAHLGEHLLLPVHGHTGFLLLPLDNLTPIPRL